MWEISSLLTLFTTFLPSLLPVLHEEMRSLMNTGTLMKQRIIMISTWTDGKYREMNNCMETKSGVKDSIPAWIKFSIQAPSEIPYNGIYYDPPEEEKYVFKNPHTKRPKSLRIYESHAGMSSIVCISLFPFMNCYSKWKEKEFLILKNHLGIIVKNMHWEVHQTV
ncbi:hypothetical protein V6Z11_D02G107500 [Gossypium hirsutum]